MSTSTVKKLAMPISLVLATAALFVPVKLTSEAKLEQNDACATGACCREVGSICDNDELIPNAYYSSAACQPVQN
jgi:hypothetical protein